MYVRKSAVGIALLSGALCAALFSSPIVQAQTWTHPGIVVSQQQLDATRAAYQAGNSVIVSQVNKAMASNYGSLTYTVQGPWSGGINQCGAYSTPNNGCSQADNDSNAAYVQALLWYITGTQTYANNAINIMNAYAANFKGYAGTNGLSCPSGTDCSNGPLQSGWDTEKWPRAAEIIRWGKPGGASSGWSSSSITAFTNMLNNVYLPVIQNGSGTNGNWDMSMIDGIMQIAVFTENASLLSTARTFWQGRVPDLYYLNSVDGSTHAASPRGTPSWFGQSVFSSATTNVAQETCRDLTHTEDSIAGTMNAAETDWIQGGNLYQDAGSYAQQRIVGSMNLMSGFEGQGGGQNAIITAPSSFCTSSGATNIGEITLGAGSTYAIGYNQYHNRLNDPNMANSTGTTGLRGTSNVYNWIQNGLLNLTETTDYGNHMTLFEALTHSVNLYQTASSTWSNTSFTAQTGTFTATFDATPSGNDINTVVGLSNGAQTAYTGLSTIVRFNPTGDIDAYNGIAYAAASTIPYTGGQTYTFEFDVNVAAQTYTVWVTPRGGSKTLVGLNYAFRTAASTLNTLTLYAQVGTNNVGTFAVNASTPSCQTASTTWSNTTVASEAKTFTATFTATPSATDINTVMALSNGAQTAYTGLPAIARFNPTGFIDAYNGTAYAAANSIPYTAGTTYAFEFLVNVPAQTYTVYVTPAGGTTTLVGQNYAFRTSTSPLNNLSLYAQVGSNSVCSVSLSNH
ncbi:alginate lyase [Edaphobacter aggregans]|uniref:Alginate lyase n=1 Tax=Edaphobacter aggregans TaxID=570835 RepID=A0A428MHG1_9BACT|nr:alginate lyase family protein [Edaphobacter aggregans]RSL16348.1 alginate lyase [Edaphobacter aggregans]